MSAGPSPPRPGAGTIGGPGGGKPGGGKPGGGRPTMLVPMIVACALFMENLDSTVIATALPQIAHSLQVDPIRLSLAITSYLMSLAIFIPASGWLADRFGARTVFSAAILVFTLSSILCGQASGLAELTIARFVQGMGGAMMVPVGRLVMVRSVEKSQLVRAMAYLTAPALLGPVLGPPVGGFLATYATWRWIFYLNVPIGIIGLVLATLFIENHREPDTPPLDRKGFVLSALALACMMVGFETIGRKGVPAGISATLMLVGAAAAALYLRHMSRHQHPILDLRLLQIPTVGVAIGGGSLFRINTGALPFLLPLLLQIGFGLSAFASGLLTFASAAGALTMKLSARPILRRFGFRQTMMINVLVCSAFFLSYATFRPGTPGLVIFLLLLVGGFFRSLQFTSINVLAFADVPPQRMSRATSLASTAQQLSQSVGVAVGAGLLHLTLALRGHEGGLAADDFWPAFVVVAMITASSSMIFARLRPEDGAEVTGHIGAKAPPAIAAAPSAPIARARAGERAPGE